MRLNIYLNEKNPKEKQVIDFLESKLNKSAFIKELLYQESNKINFIENVPYKEMNLKLVDTLKTPTKLEEEYEEILALDDINF